MKLFLAALALLGALVPSVSSAGIVYQWKALNNQPPLGIQLELEFDYSTVASGSFTLDIDPDRYPLSTLDPNSGLLRFSYSATDLAYFHLNLNYLPREESFPGHGRLKLDLQFQPGGFLTGSIYSSTISPDNIIRMKSQGRVFEVSYAGVEYGQVPGMGCGWAIDIECAGAKGQIRRADIPEPRSLALLAIGFAGVAGIRRQAMRTV